MYIPCLGCLRLEEWIENWDGHVGGGCVDSYDLHRYSMGRVMLWNLQNETLVNACPC